MLHSMIHPVSHPVRVTPVVCGTVVCCAVVLGAWGLSSARAEGMPQTVVSQHQSQAGAQNGAAPWTATPINAWDASDAPEDVMGEPVVQDDGVVHGHVGAVKMDPHSQTSRVQAVRIDPKTGPAYWVDADRVWITPDAVRVAAANPQTASLPRSFH